MKLDEYGWELVEIKGEHFAFTDLRVPRFLIPEGYHLYHIRGDDDCGDPCSIEYGVLVNHFGTLVSNRPLVIPKFGIEISYEDMNYEGIVYRKFSEYTSKFPPNQEPLGL